MINYQLATSKERSNAVRPHAFGQFAHRKIAFGQHAHLKEFQAD